MRLAITTGTFHPESGGPPTYLHRLGQELVARGHEIRLLSFGEPSGHHYAHSVTRVTRRLPVPPRLAVYTAHVARLAPWADVLFASDYGLPATLITRLVRRPLVLRVAGDFAWESAVRRGLVPRDNSINDFQQHRKRGRVALLDGIQRFYARRADRVIVPSDYLAGLVRGWGVAPERVRVVHNAVEGERFQINLTAEAAKERLGVRGPVLLSIARLVAWKGVDQLIRVVAGRRDLTLLHCGEGPEEARLRALAEELGAADRVQLRGRVPREDIPTYMRAADLFALYSGYEGMPHVVLEALAAGVPVVVSDRGGNREVVSDGVDGLVARYDDPTTLAATISRLLEERGLAARLAAAGRASVAERFGWPRLVDQTVAVLEEARRC